jgi:hypothetical protein
MRFGIHNETLAPDRAVWNIIRGSMMYAPVVVANDDNFMFFVHKVDYVVELVRRTLLHLLEHRHS